MSNAQTKKEDQIWDSHHRIYILPVGWRILLREDGIRVVVNEEGAPQILTLYGGLFAAIVNAQDQNKWLLEESKIVDDDDMSGNTAYSRSFKKGTD